MMNPSGLIFKLVMIALMTMSFANCSPNSSAGSSAAVVKSTGNNLVKAEDVSSIRYFRGGWYGPPDMPSWSHDMTFTFNSDGTVSIRSLIPESPGIVPMMTPVFVECDAKTGPLSAENKSQFMTLIDSLKIGPLSFGAIDGGVNLLEITLKSGEMLRVYLPYSDFVGEDQMYALEGGEELVDFLKALDATMIAPVCSILPLM